MFQSIVRISLLLLVFGMSQAVSAKEFIPQFGISIEDHSNATKNDISPQGDTLFVPYAGFTFEEETSLIQSSIQFRVNREQYADDTFDTKNLFTMDGFIDWEIVPGRYIWVVEDAASSRRIDQTEPDSLGNSKQNLQNFNVLMTGPDVLLRRGVYQVVLKARLADVYYSEAATDNQRLLLSGAVNKDLNDYSKIGFDASVSFVRFEEDFNVDYDIGSMLATYDRELPFGTLELRGGFNFVNHQNAKDETGAIGELALQIGRAGAPNTFRFSASKKFSDPALEAFDPLYTRLFDLGGERQVNSAETTGTGAFETRQAEANYSFSGDRVGLNVFAFFRESDFPINPTQATDEYGGGVGVYYLLRQNLRAFANYYQFRSELPNSSASAGQNRPVTAGDTSTVYTDGTSPGFGLTYNISDTLSLSVGAVFTENDSNEQRRQFTDDVAYFRIDYKGTAKGE